MNRPGAELRSRLYSSLIRDAVEGSLPSSAAGRGPASLPSNPADAPRNYRFADSPNR